MSNNVQYKYRIRTDNATVTLTYFVEQLRKVEIDELKNFGDLQYIFRAIDEDRLQTLENMKKSKAKIRELKVDSTNQKIALWCELYKKRYGYNYQVSTVDASAMKNTDVSVELINLFFDITEWWSNEKTIGRYTKNINEIKRIFTGAKKAEQSAKGQRNQQRHRTDLGTELQRRFGNTKQ